jgi:hypothetical protein
VLRAGLWVSLNVLVGSPKRFLVRFEAAVSESVKASSNITPIESPFCSSLVLRALALAPLSLCSCLTSSTSSSPTQAGRPRGRNLCPLLCALSILKSYTCGLLSSSKAAVVETCTSTPVEHSGADVERRARTERPDTGQAGHARQFRSNVCSSPCLLQFAGLEHMFECPLSVIHGSVNLRASVERARSSAGGTRTEGTTGGHRLVLDVVITNARLYDRWKLDGLQFAWNYDTYLQACDTAGGTGTQGRWTHTRRIFASQALGGSASIVAGIPRLCALAGTAGSHTTLLWHWRKDPAAAQGPSTHLAAPKGITREGTLFFLWWWSHFRMDPLLRMDPLWRLLKCADP